MNDQQIETLIAYLKTIQIPRRTAADEAGDPNCDDRHLPADMPGRHRDQRPPAVDDGTYDTYGEALFNLDLDGGAYSCARCHTKGWSYGEPGVAGPAAPSGRTSPAATRSAQFPDAARTMVDFVTRPARANGAAATAPAGSQGTGRACPAFGASCSTRPSRSQAIVEYERSL